MTELPEILKLIALGGAAGVLSGMLGIGGGLLIVPARSVLIFLRHGRERRRSARRSS